jgi:glycosyltransferase involved in cell wall biosynthesis
MAKKIDEISVFFPTFNEEGNIEKVVKKAKEVLDKVAGKWEIIIVDDGSSDATPRITNEIAKADKRISVVHHPQNKGYGGALKTGFEKAKYPWVAFTDSDGQFDFSEIESFIARKDDADLILGYRKKRADSFARKVFTFGWSTLARLLLGLKAKDYSCGFKMIKKSVYEDIQPLVGEEKVTQIEMLVKARKKGFKFVEIGVSHYPRLSGKQTGAKLSVVIKSVVDMFSLWARMHGITKKEVFVVLGILAIGAFFRLYRISEYMIYLGDEGRDMIIVRRMLTEFHPPLIGPGTSVGNMYLGPLYYYMMAIPTLLANFSPVGPAVMVSLLGVATIALVWFVGREWFNKTAGLTASLLYAISPTVIAYSNFSWNPNIMPFFALLTMYAVWKVKKTRELRWLVVMMVSYAFVLQSHYFGLFLAPVMFFYWLKSRSQIKNTLYSLLLFLLLMSPLVIFDLRHDFLNFNAIKNFSTQGSSSFTTPLSGGSKFVSTLTHATTRILGGRNDIAGTILTITLAVGAIWLIKIKKLNSVLLWWLLVGIFGLSLYKYKVLDHYMGFIFPALFILFGAILSKLPRYLIVIAVVLMVGINLLEHPFKNQPNRQLERSREIASLIREKSKGQRLNIATITDRSNRDPYAYFLLLWGVEVVDTDPNAVAYTVTDQLFVVCELPKEKCDPLYDPTTWITNFGWSKITGSWEVAGAYVYKLAHSK